MENGDCSKDFLPHKFPWAMTLGAIQDNSLIYEMTSKIAEDCKRMGIYWDFAPVVDVNTNLQILLLATEVSVQTSIM